MRATPSNLKLANLIVVAILCMGAKDPRIDSLINKALFASPEQKVSIAKQILAINQKSGDAYAVSGDAKYLKGDYDGAFKDLTKSIELNPENKLCKFRAYELRYQCYIKQRDWEKATKDALESFKINRSPRIAHDLSLLYAKSGDTKNAQAYAALSQRLQTSMQDDFKERMQQMQDSKNPDRVDKLLVHLNDRLKSEPKDVRLLSLRSDCYVTKKDYTKALSDANTIVAELPTNGRAYSLRAKIYEKMGNAKQAASDDRKAKELGFDAEAIKKQLKEKFGISATHLK